MPTAMTDYTARKARAAVATLLDAQARLLVSRSEIGPDAAAMAETEAARLTEVGRDATDAHGQLFQVYTLRSEMAHAALARANRLR